MGDFSLPTERLILRAWRPDDADALHAICSDPVVMTYLGPAPSRAAIDASIIAYSPET